MERQAYGLRTNTTESCDSVVGCWRVAVVNGTPCADGDVCNGDETCQSGVCTDGTALECDDGNICTDNDCDGTLGCLDPRPNTAACPLQLISAKKLNVKVKAAKPKKNRLIFLSKGTFDLPARADDFPTAAGATLRVRDGAGQDVSFDLPKGSWKALGSKGFSYKDAKRQNGRARR